MTMQCFLTWADVSSQSAIFSRRSLDTLAEMVANSFADDRA